MEKQTKDGELVSIQDSWCIPLVFEVFDLMEESGHMEELSINHNF